MPLLRTLQLLCLLTYAGGLAAAFSLLAGPMAQLAWRASLALLAVHALECLLARRWLALYPGPRWLSIAWTLLFGALHWWPLRVRAQRREEAP